MGFQNSATGPDLGFYAARCPISDECSRRPCSDLGRDTLIEIAGSSAVSLDLSRVAECGSWSHWINPGAALCPLAARDAPQCHGLWVFDRLWVVPVFGYCG